MLFVGLVPLVISYVVAFAAALDVDPDSWFNDQYTRTVELSKSYVRESILLSIKNTAIAPQDTYYFYLCDGFDFVKDLALISAVLIKNREPLDIVAVNDGEATDDRLFKITLPYPVSPQSNVDINVQYNYMNSVRPFPEKIELNDIQKLLLKTNKFPYSAYATKDYQLAFGGVGKSEEMDLHLSDNSAITKGLPALEGRVESNMLVYGPLFSTVGPKTISPMGLLYTHMKSVPKVTRLDRSVWIPGLDVVQLPVEEYFELTNDGAALASGFSRFDFMKGRYGQDKNHFSLLQLEFPFTDSNTYSDYYYTDLVGKVDTHQIIQDHLVIQPRYPLFGGWKYNFTIGWNQKVTDSIHRIIDEEDTYIMLFPIVNGLKDVTYDTVYLSFYLPEGAEFVNVSSPIPFDNLEVSSDLSYFDVAKGHTKITLTFTNVIDAVTNLNVFIQYKYASSSFAWKILKISGFVFAALTSYFLLGRLDLSVEDKKSKK